MQISATSRYDLTPVRMANINKSRNKSWQGCGGKGTLMHCWWECRLVQPPWKAVWNYLKKLKMELTYALAILLLGIHPKKSETLIKRTCTPMFIAALFTKAMIWKQPNCPSIDEWIKKALVHLHSGILLSCLKKEGNHTFCNSMDGPGEYYAK